MLYKYLRGTQVGYLNAYSFAVQMVNMPKLMHVGHVLAAVWMTKELVSAQVPSSTPHSLHGFTCLLYSSLLYASSVSCIPPC